METHPAKEQDDVRTFKEGAGGDSASRRKAASPLAKGTFQIVSWQT